MKTKCPKCGGDMRPVWGRNTDEDFAEYECHNCHNVCMLPFSSEDVDLPEPKFNPFKDAVAERIKVLEAAEVM